MRRRGRFGRPLVRALDPMVDPARATEFPPGSRATWAYGASIVSASRRRSRLSYRGRTDDPRITRTQRCGYYSLHLRLCPHTSPL